MFTHTPTHTLSPLQYWRSVFKKFTYLHLSNLLNPPTADPPHPPTKLSRLHLRLSSITW
uniref:Uncharacterized protein n=1 Tax=Anguilla anguilla TaxID=7936 RepID=A0A0E9RFC7_ANGAN